MGYELNKLLQQYGVSTPSMSNYVGTAKPDIPTAPTTPTYYDSEGNKMELGFKSTTPDASGTLGQILPYIAGVTNPTSTGTWYFNDPDKMTASDKVSLDKFNTLYNQYYGSTEADRNAQYQQQLSQYNADSAAYDKYKADYQNRMSNTPMYMSSQYNTSAPQLRPDQAEYDASIRNYFLANPNLSSSDIEAAKQKYGVSSRDIYNATGGNTWGNYAQMPQYGVYTNPDISVPTYAEGGSVESDVDPLTYFYQDAYAPTPEVPAISEKEPITLESYRFTEPFPKIPSIQLPSDAEYGNTVVNLPPQDINPYQPQAPAVAPVKPQKSQIEQLLDKYGSNSTSYNKEMALARKNAQAETDAFTNMLKSTMSNPEQDNLSKAELYFRLAAAFGSPTKTKQGFIENMGNAGQQMSEYSKGQREAAINRNALNLEGQKIRMQAAKEDLRTLQSLAAEEMKDKRAAQAALIKTYMESNQPKSELGKTAYDLSKGSQNAQYGSEEFRDQLKELVNKKDKLEQTREEVAKGNLAINQQKFAKESKDLTTKELELKSNSQELVNSANDALSSLEEALRINRNTRASDIGGTVKQKILGAAGSPDPVTVATNRLNNLLKSKTYSELKAKFGSQLSDGERKALESISGSEAKSPAEREVILIDAIANLRNAKKRAEKTFSEISSGKYGQKTP